MRIGGFNKLTTQDFPGNLACIIFTNGCNFDCDYCYNRDLVESHAPEISEEEMDIMRMAAREAGVIDETN